MNDTQCRFRKGVLLVVLIVAAVFLNAIASLLLKNAFKSTLPLHKLSSNVKNDKKVVLVWADSIISLSDNNLVYHESLFRSKCESKGIVITYNKTDINEAYVVLFPLAGITKDTQLPKKAFEEQKFVLFTYEAPETDIMLRRNDNRYRLLDDFFDLTLTYRSDSEVVIPYMRYHLEDDTSGHNSKSEYVKSLKKKTKMAAWFVSNRMWVTSDRNKIVSQLQRYGIDVDVYEENGTFTCPKAEDDKCLELLDRKYKFYLAFENSNCIDYITEKFFKVVDLKVVPVVLGGGDYKSVVPEGTFVDVASYKSIKELVKYLLRLDGNDTMYLELFKWKFDKRVVKERPIKSMLCELDQYLSSRPFKDSRRKYLNFTKWWYHEKCITTVKQFNRTYLEKYYNYQK